METVRDGVVAQVERAGLTATYAWAFNFDHVKEGPVKRFLLLILLLACTSAFSQAKKTTGADPWAGTWKMDIAKSKLHPPAPKEESVTVDSVTKESIKYTVKGTDAEGKAYTVTFDGKPGTASPQLVDGKEVAQITYQMPSPHELAGVSHGSDGSTGTIKITLSQDAKTATLHEHHKDAKGEYDETAVYVRQ
jgi:hypothetical protein